MKRRAELNKVNNHLRLRKLMLEGAQVSRLAGPLSVLSLQFAFLRVCMQIFHTGAGEEEEQNVTESPDKEGRRTTDMRTWIFY
jgi:hypothetical protein